MKNKTKSEQNIEEDYFVKATLNMNGNEINGVPCKIYLPERINQKPYMVFKPSKEDADKIIMSSHKGSFKASIIGYDKEIQTTIESPEVYFSGSFTKPWGEDLFETTIPGKPQDLHVIHHLRNDESPEITRVTFWISPNGFLSPNMICYRSYTGEIKYEIVRSFNYSIKDEVQLKFEKHFKSKTTKNGDFIQWSFLVACADTNVSADDVERLKIDLLPDIDDFLLIASFVLRKRTICMGWAATDKNSCTTFFRGNYSFPEFDDDSSVDDGVVDIQYFEKFIQICHPAFLKFKNKLAIRNALYSTIPSKSQILETSFLRTFSGLETLILEFRRMEVLEFTLPNDEWQNLKKYIEKCIKESTNPKLESKQRASIYRKLDELNRLSLNEAFELFCRSYDIDLRDLWPVFNRKGIVGLAAIRNRLIHGDPFPHDLTMALFVANEHMKYTLERVILRVLDWDIADTKVSPAYLEKHSNIIKIWSSEQTRLFEYVNNLD